MKLRVFREMVIMVKANERGQALFFSGLPFNHKKSPVIVLEGQGAIGWRSLVDALHICFSFALPRSSQGLGVGNATKSFLQAARFPSLLLNGECKVISWGS
ncbi:hypothetical protein L1049_000037 [Liquidambar formosana]|uniref:Uncharacterized protein n=1 Tax=Liquidambar formosana TaxID=63359 RepID=A0AAP0R2K7_LIQFO